MAVPNAVPMPSATPSQLRVDAQFAAFGEASRAKRRRGAGKNSLIEDFLLFS